MKAALILRKASLTHDDTRQPRPRGAERRHVTHVWLINRRVNDEHEALCNAGANRQLVEQLSGQLLADH